MKIDNTKYPQISRVMAKKGGRKNVLTLVNDFFSKLKKDGVIIDGSVENVGGNLVITVTPADEDEG